MESFILSLGELGLTSYEASAYVALLSRSSFTPTELATHAKIPRQRIYDVLKSLEDKGLCLSKDTSPRTFMALDPQLALEALSRQRTEELERERQRTAQRASELMAALAPMFQLGRGHNDPLSYIDVLGDPVRIASMALKLAQGAHHQVNSCIKRPMVLNQEQNWTFIREPLSRGVMYRALYEYSALKDEELYVWMTTFQSWGQEIRLVPELPIKMQVFDEDAVLVSLQDPVGGTPSFTAIAIRHRGMVAMMNLAFEQLWERGEPFKE
ncbi:TrmB family transcriptional regulator [Oscillatoria sp. FACHB-1407]|nr:TrmB family transcriptional regulator [Oscillatoria sp. FACHB-1407]